MENVRKLIHPIFGGWFNPDSDSKIKTSQEKKIIVLFIIMDIKFFKKVI